MTKYVLKKNGLVVENVSFSFPDINDQFTIRFLDSTGVVPKDPSLLSSLKLSSGILNEKGGILTPAIAISCDVDVGKFSQQQFDQNSIQFAQTIQVVEDKTTYLGSTPHNGITTISLKDENLIRMLDCTTKPDENFTDSIISRNFPYYNEYITTKSKAPHRIYSAKMDDTPGCSVPLFVVNRKADRFNNYLQRHERSMTFNMIIIFVHADGTREPLESRVWSCEMSIQLAWNDFKPVVVDQSVKTFFLDEKKTEFFNSDFERLVSANKVINVLTNVSTEAGYRNSRNFDYVESPAAIAVPGFWTAKV